MAAGEAFVLLGQIDAALKQRVVEICAVYPDSDSANVAEEYAVVETFDGTRESFAAACSRVVNSSELLALNTHIDVQEVLDVLATREAFVALYLDSVDAVILQRLGSYMVRISRSEPLTRGVGRSLLLELNDVRIRASKLLALVRPKTTDHTFAYICGGIALAAVFVGGLYVLRPRQYGSGVKYKIF